ncbi:MAG: S-methyl-5-thioribose-1-phosphate isomerase [Bacteroidales bacterium]|nr:S-methyl-5-thioribose-1-phosphate isomerase [Candidatus Latescibacterota bacterium]
MTLIDTVDYTCGRVRIIDQTLLPGKDIRLDLDCVEDVADAIRSLKVRGAPAIGIAAAYGVLLELENILAEGGVDGKGFIFDRASGFDPERVKGLDIGLCRDRLITAIEKLALTRPTAVNLFQALDMMRLAVESEEPSPEAYCGKIAGEAFRIHEEELEVERRIGLNGARLISDGMTILTHCNAGGLATAGLGTALSVIYSASDQGKKVKVFADETRPLLQGARLTAYELEKNGIDTTVICDSAAHPLIASGKVDIVITGADRIAANGDTANKIGTFGLASTCDRFDIPFFVAAPLSTFDPATRSGEGIVIEERSGTELTHFNGTRIVPEGVHIYNPAFDVTPSDLISGIITEKSVIRAPYGENIRQLFISTDK